MEVVVVILLCPSVGDEMPCVQALQVIERGLRHWEEQLEMLASDLAQREESSAAVDRQVEEEQRSFTTRKQNLSIHEEELETWAT